jgi:pimeloyl-ACP methyl ester carboxylesterase
MGMTKGLNGRRGWMLATLSAALVLAGCGNNHHSASGQGIPVAQTRFLVSTAAYTATLSSAASASSQTIVYSMPAVTGSGTVNARAVVLVPKGTPPVQGWPMVVWAHGTTGVADGCEPSATSDLAQYDGLVAQLLQRGFMVVAPDYEGLGHSPTSNHPYLNRDSEARSMLYAAMAAREQVAAAGLRWVAMGHSQGGHAALAAAELASEASQAGGLQLRGVVALAPASNLEVALAGLGQQIAALEAPLKTLIQQATALQAQAQAAQSAGNLAEAQQLAAQAQAKQAEVQQWLASSAGQAALGQATALTVQLNLFGSLVVAGERAVMPSLQFSDVFGARGAAIAASSEQAGICNPQLVAQLGSTAPAQLGDVVRYVQVEQQLPSTYPGLRLDFTSTAAGQDFLNRSRIGTRALNVPVLVLQGEQDTTVPRQLTDMLIGQMVQAGNPRTTVPETSLPQANLGVNYQVLGASGSQSVDHGGVVTAGAPSMLAFLNQVR